MKSSVVLTFALLATSTSASSDDTIPLTRVDRTGSYLKGSADADRARAAFLKSRTTDTAPPTNLSFMVYTANVGIGNPPTYYNLMVDTGSSNTLCGTGKPYVRTSTSISTKDDVNIVYGSGYMSGLEYLDQVTLAPNLVITNQSIGDAISYAGFEGIDGIIGVGPVGLTLGTLSPDVNATVPTVMNNLASQNLIENQVLGVYFVPLANYSNTDGALTIGGVDPSLYEGELTYVPVTKTNPAANYWGINITLSTYGTYIVIPTSTAGIVDTGTTLVLLADNFFTVYLDAIPGAKVDSSTGLIEIPTSSIPYMQPLNFTIADGVFCMDVAAQLIPKDQNPAWGGVPGKQYGVISNMGSNSGEGFDFILGQVFMERYYAVFDTDANSVGLAQTNNTFSVYQGSKIMMGMTVFADLTTIPAAFQVGSPFLVSMPVS